MAFLLGVSGVQREADLDLPSAFEVGLLAAGVRGPAASSRCHMQVKRQRSAANRAFDVDGGPEQAFARMRGH
jgi:hypothetical protein